PGGRLEAEEDEGAEEGRRAEGFAAGDVVHEEPHRDDGGADQAGDDAFPQNGALWARHGRTRAYGSTTLVAARAPVGSRSPNSAGPAKATSGGPRRSRDRRGAMRRRGSHAACRRAGPSDSPRASTRNSGRRTSRHSTRDRRRRDRTVRAAGAASVTGGTASATAASQTRCTGRSHGAPPASPIRNSPAGISTKSTRI